MSFGVAEEKYVPMLMREMRSESCQSVNSNGSSRQSWSIASKQRIGCAGMANIVASTFLTAHSAQRPCFSRTLELAPRRKACSRRFRIAGFFSEFWYTFSSRMMISLCIFPPRAGNVPCLIQSNALSIVKPLKKLRPRSGRSGKEPSNEAVPAERFENRGDRRIGHAGKRTSVPTHLARRQRKHFLFDECFRELHERKRLVRTNDVLGARGDARCAGGVHDVKRGGRISDRIRRITLMQGGGVGKKDCRNIKHHAVFLCTQSPVSSGSSRCRVTAKFSDLFHNRPEPLFSGKHLGEQATTELRDLRCDECMPSRLCRFGGHHEADAAVGLPVILGQTKKYRIAGQSRNVRGLGGTGNGSIDVSRTQTHVGKAE